MLTQEFPPEIFALLIAAFAFFGFYLGLIANARFAFSSRTLVGGLILMAAGIVGMAALLYAGAQVMQTVILLKLCAAVFAATIILGKDPAPGQ